MSENPAVPSLDENMSISQRVNLLSHRFNSQFDSEAVGSLIHVAKQNTNKIAVDLNGGLLPQSEINACIGQFRYTVYQILNEKRISDQFDHLEKLLPDEYDNSNDSSNSSNSYNSNNFTENGNYDGIIKNANSFDNDEFSDMADLEKLERLKENLTKEIEHLSKENRNLKELQNQNPTKYVIPQSRDSFFEYKNKIRQVENNLKIKERYIEYEMKENEKKIAQENHEIAVLQGSISHARYRLSKIDDRFGLINQAKSIPRSFNNLLGNNLGGNNLGGNKGAQTARIVVPKQNLNNSSPRSKKFAKTQDSFMPVQEPVSNSAQVSPRNRKLRGNSEEDIENRVYFTLERNDDCEPIGENLPSKLDLPSNIETFA